MKRDAPLHTFELTASVAIVRDIESAMSKWQEVAEDDPWLMREILFLQALLPVSIYLEQAGEYVECAELIDLNKLTKLVARAKPQYGSRFTLVVSQLERCLNIIPAYREVLGGDQLGAAIEHYGQISALMKNLRTAAALG